MNPFYFKVFFGYSFLMFSAGVVLALIHNFVFGWADYVGSAWIAVLLGLAGFCVTFHFKENERGKNPLKFDMTLPLVSWLAIVYGMSNESTVFMGISAYWLFMSLMYGLLYSIGYANAFTPKEEDNNNQKPAN